MTDEELIVTLRGRSRFCRDRNEIKSPDLMDTAADRIEQLVSERDTIREAALREAADAVNKVFNGFPNRASDAILGLIGEKK